MHPAVAIPMGSSQLRRRNEHSMERQEQCWLDVQASSSLHDPWSAASALWIVRCAVRCPLFFFPLLMDHRACTDDRTSLCPLVPPNLAGSISRADSAPTASAASCWHRRSSIAPSCALVWMPRLAVRFAKPFSSTHSNGRDTGGCRGAHGTRRGGGLGQTSQHGACTPTTARQHAAQTQHDRSMTRPGKRCSSHSRSAWVDDVPRPGPPLSRDRVVSLARSRLRTADDASSTPSRVC